MLWLLSVCRHVNTSDFTNGAASMFWTSLATFFYVMQFCFNLSLPCAAKCDRHNLGSSGTVNDQKYTMSTHRYAVTSPVIPQIRLAGHTHRCQARLHRYRHSCTDTHTRIRTFQSADTPCPTRGYGKTEV